MDAPSADIHLVRSTAITRTRDTEIKATVNLGGTIKKISLIVDTKEYQKAKHQKNDKEYIIGKVREQLPKVSTTLKDKEHKQTEEIKVVSPSHKNSEFRETIHQVAIEQRVAPVMAAAAKSEIKRSPGEIQNDIKTKSDEFEFIISRLKDLDESLKIVRKDVRTRSSDLTIQKEAFEASLEQINESYAMQINKAKPEQKAKLVEEKGVFISNTYNRSVGSYETKLDELKHNQAFLENSIRNLTAKRERLENEINSLADDLELAKLAAAEEKSKGAQNQVEPPKVEPRKGWFDFYRKSTPPTKP
jgi:uncharacterized protein YoxC